VLALLLVGIAFALGQLGDWRAELGRFQALMLVAFAAYALAVARRTRWRVLPGAGAFVVVAALALRVAVLGTPPTLSDDLYRYAWEGRVLAHGADPYAHAPADPALAGLRDREIQPRVNHPELRAIYPPLAELGFALVARVRDSLLAQKLWVLLHDLALCALLAWWCAARGTRAEHASGSAWDALVYAWNPLAVAEYAGSGHFDPTGMLWLVLALALAERRGPRANHASTPASHGSAAGSAASLVAAVGVKLVALAALPFLARAWSVRVRVACTLAIAALLAAYVALARGPGSGLEAFATRWRHNDSLFALVAAGAGDRVARVVVAGAMLALIAWVFHRRVAALDATRLCLRAGLLLSPVLHPWYLGWALALEPLGPSAAWLALSCTVLLGYGSFAPPAAGGAYHPGAWIKLIEFGVPLLVATVTRRRRTTRPDRS
jgi:hypothetical protein